MKRNYYIFSDTLLRRKNNTLYFDTIEKNIDNNDSDILCNAGSKITQSLRNRIVPVEDVNSIFTYGQVNFNTKLMSFLSEYKIPLHVYNSAGNYSGTFYPKDHNFSDNIFLKQARIISDVEKRIMVALEIIKASAENTGYSLRILYRRGYNVKSYIEINDELTSNIGKAVSLKDLSLLLSDVKYFFRDSWHDIFKKYTGIKFKLEDRLKAIFNFTEMLIKSTCLTEIYRNGMISSLGFGIKKEETGNSLCKDLSSIFSSIIIQRIFLSMLINNEIEFRSFITNKKFCMLTPEIIKFIVGRFDIELNSSYTIQGRDNKINIHNLISCECIKLSDTIIKGEQYNAYRIED